MTEPNYDDEMKVFNTIEFEVSANGQHYIFVFQINFDIRYDPDVHEVVIDCSEERIDSIY